jgi:hypothetical protein
MTYTPTFTPTPTCVINVWPDPFNSKYAVNSALKISCMNPRTKVSIYTISGELVQTLDQTTACQVVNTWGTVYCWNGRNRSNWPVSTGVYFYVVFEDDKVVQRGKFLVVNTS